MKNEISQKKLKQGQILYIIEAAIEYFISILVAGSYLATLTKYLGFSDSLTGILSSIISLGCLFQLLSLSINRKRVKSFVIVMSIINQLLFMLLYVVPFFPVEQNIKIVLFVILILSAYIIYNFAHPKKIAWLMSLVDDTKRGVFTAYKEIVSLIGGMIFMLIMGAVVDNFTEKGEFKTAFLISAAVMLVMTVLHTLTMIFTAEKKIAQPKNTSFLNSLKSFSKNKALIKVLVIFLLYFTATYITTPFYGTYLIGELNFSLTFVSVITIGSSIVRILVSRFWGKYADKYSFNKLMRNCLAIFSVALFCAMFATPQNGKIMFSLYYVFHGIAMGGINSSLINLVFDVSSLEERSDSLAICQAVSGLFGFLITLAASPIITIIQNNSNQIFGITIYAQQLLSIIGFIITIIAVIFISKTNTNNQKKTV